jgi:hypothetical protein
MGRIALPSPILRDLDRCGAMGWIQVRESMRGPSQVTKFSPDCMSCACVDATVALVGCVDAGAGRRRLDLRILQHDDENNDGVVVVLRDGRESAV